MHFEINKGLKDVARIAKKCKAASAPKPTTPAPKPPSRPHLTVDGDLGPKTISLWQKIMKTPVDGKISDKNSDLIEAVQRRLQATVDHRLVVDGDLGPKTIRRLQGYLKAPVDGILGPNTVKALQRRLNTGKF
jgi:peptidoglycan hydrolase-like protein with peptidoglycan-binding domain